MSEPVDDGTVRIANARKLVSLFFVLSGVMGFFVSIPLVGVLWLGQWGLAIFLAALVAGMAFLGLLCDYLIPKTVFVLAPDRMEISEIRWKTRIIRWCDVQKITWPRIARSEQLRVVLTLPNSSRFNAPRISLSNDTISSGDRLTVIRYLRLAGKSIPQENWETFCEQMAAPWGDAWQKEEDEKQGLSVKEEPEFWVAAWTEKFLQLSERHPFLAGILAPCVAPFAVTAVMERRTWWWLALIFGVSGAINMPLIFGWNWPVVCGVIGCPLLLLIASVFSPPRNRAAQNTVHHVPGGLLLAMIPIFGIPFFMMALVRGWISDEFAKWFFVGCSFGWLPFVLVAMALKENRAKKERREERESLAMQRWHVYEVTGRMPEAEAT